MRRMDREYDAGGGRGFRVLDPGGRYLEPLTPPPPPRAPEPYKVAPPSSSLGRAHRRSSFVIIAETRPATPSSRSSSPTLLATGRVSPFRGRGFKGPLPHAQSRPQSPENHQQGGRGRGRFDKRTTVSQQSSPKRSLIPKPTRRRSVSLTKTIEKKPSPKFGRRARVTRKNSNLGNAGGNISRRQSLKAPDLSPIQGTPTKPVEANGRVRGGNFIDARASPLKTRNTLTVPKNIGNARRTNQDRSPSKGLTTTKRFVEEKKSNGVSGSPTKIPVRRGSLVNKNGSTQSLSTSRNPGKSTKPGERVAKGKNEIKPEFSSKANGNRDLRPPGNREDRIDNKKENNDPPGSRFIDMSSSSELRKREADLGLMDLLKQSSGATGTSSVVNTTTTTAVQPLQIEAAGILLENDRTNAAEANNDKISTPLPSSASLNVSPAVGLSPTVTNEISSLPKSPKASTNVHRGTSGISKKAESREIQVGSSTVAPGSNNPSQKNSGKVNATDEPTQTANLSSNKKETNVASNSKEKTNREQGSTLGGVGASKKTLLTRNGLQEGSRNEIKVPSANPGTRVNNSNNNSNNNSSNERNGGGREAITVQESIETSGKLLSGKVIDGVSSLGSDHQKSDGKSSTRSALSNVAGNGDAGGKRTQSRNAGAANTGNIESSINPGVPVTGNGEDGKVRTNHGSETSLKSSNGLSTSSVDSIRSTDTGVSVNTVRGVSSAREKKGMHMMKKSEEIETLSGNLMHLERNGEPAVLDITEAPEDPPQSVQTRLGRFNKSLTGFYDRLPSMRCLGCRRNQKEHPWPGERPNQSVQQRELPANGDNVNTGNSRCHRVWTNLKNACRCMRLRECKCCRRAARVAPAESNPSCCPPERRCGALCRRLFSRCKCCNRSEAQHTRSIRAKHSLTSVAPPPLSEEQRAKIPEVLVEHNSVMRGAIPCLPVPLAWFCLIWNVLLPGSGTIWSGLFNLCVGQPRFSVSASSRARFGALVVNAIVGIGQFFTVLFCLVGWGWSIWWGVTMIRLARKYKRFRASEAANIDAEARSGEPTSLPPGVPSQALRGMERAR